MPIIYNEKTREFHLYNQEISYIIKILDNDQPGQLYYGKRLTRREDFSHLFEYAMRDMSPYAFEGNSTFSLENIKQEYPTFGCGDMRFLFHIILIYAMLGFFFYFLIFYSPNFLSSIKYPYL